MQAEQNEDAFHEAVDNVHAEADGRGCQSGNKKKHVADKGGRQRTPRRPVLLNLIVPIVPPATAQMVTARMSVTACKQVSVRK